MALLTQINPTVNIINITNAVKRGSELISNGSFYWSVDAAGEAPPTSWGNDWLTQGNYRNGAKCYKWESQNGGPITFKATDNTISFNANISITTYSITATGTVKWWSGPYATQAEAQAEKERLLSIMNLANNYTYSIREESDGKWSVCVTYLQTNASTRTHSISATFQAYKYVTELPVMTRPTLKEVKTGDRQISATLTNVEANHSVGLWVKNASTDILAGYQTYNGPISSITLTVSGLEYGIKYLYSVTDTFENENPSYYYIKQKELWFYPTPKCDLEVGYNSVYFKTSNGYANKIRANVYQGNTSTIVGSYQGSIANFTIDKLSPGTDYTYSIWFDRDYGTPGTLSGSFTTKTIPMVSNVNTSNRSITAIITNIAIGDSITLTVEKVSNGKEIKETYTRNSSSYQDNCTLKINNLDYDTDYIYTITSYGGRKLAEASFRFDSPPYFIITNVSFYSVDIKVNNVPSGKTIKAWVYVGSSSAGEVAGIYEGLNSSFTIENLLSNKSYSITVWIDDKEIEYEGSNIFTTLSTPIVGNLEKDQENKKVSIYVSNISDGDTVTFWVREERDKDGSLGTVQSDSYKKTSSLNPYTTLTIGGLEYDVNYVYSVTHYNGKVKLVDQIPFIIESPIKPSYTIEEGYKRAIINIVDTKNNDTISVLVKKNSTGEIVYNNSNAPNSITINNLTYGGIRYDVVIKVNNEDIDGPEYFYTLTPAQSVEYWPEVKMVAIIISNIGQNDTVTLTLTGGTLNVNESYTAQADGTVYGWDFEVEWDTNYNYSVDIKYSNGETIHLKDDTFNLVSPKYSITNITTSSFTINVFDAKASSSVKVTAGWMAQQGYSDSDNQVSFVFNDLELGTGYEITVSVADYPVNGKDIAYTLFDWWISTIGQGLRMNVYNNKPSPVKAVEWNKLVDLVNEKKLRSISSVSAGQEMIASNNGNISQVAEALGVSVASGRITAQFFLDLKTAINNILN